MPEVVTNICPIVTESMRIKGSDFLLSLFDRVPRDPLVFRTIVHSSSHTTLRVHECKVRKDMGIPGTLGCHVRHYAVVAGTPGGKTGRLGWTVCVCVDP